VVHPRLSLPTLLAVWVNAALAAAPPAQADHPLAPFGIHQLVFAARISGTDHYYVNFGYYVNNPSRKGYRNGGRLCRLDLRTGRVSVLLDDPNGGVRDPQMHYDGTRILFSYRKGGSPYYHLYEINSDGTRLRQLTDGPYDDVEPTYLPDGGILFGSSRCYRWVACWYTPVAILYRCDADGGNLRMISSSIVHDNTPAVLPDGRVLYTRWEYVDRSRVRYHHLWVVNPDGTGQMVYYGNMHGSTVMIDAKPIPGSNRVVASFSPGHGRPEHAGDITIINPDAGPDMRSRARRITHGKAYHDPYPVAPDHFLVALDRSIVLIDDQGHSQVLYTLPASAGKLRCHEPIPFGPRARERVIGSRVDLRQPTGRLALVDVTYGRNMAGVSRGDVKKLLVLEQLPKQANFSGGMEPLSLGGTFTLKRILGTVPVEPDGSAHFHVPALRSVFFVALDRNDLSVKRMQSFVTVQPGEVTSCAGCHENRFRTPEAGAQPLAMTRPASRIEPIGDVPDVLDFPRDVQPILDRHCVRCHDYVPHGGDGPRSGGAILAPDRGPLYSHSYATLLTKGLVSHGRDADGNRAPRTIGSSASRLMKKIHGSHHKVSLTSHERTVVRLWIDTGVTYPGTYAALGTGMVRVATPHTDLYARCAGCHPHDQRRRTVRFPIHEELLYNLSRPDKSLILLAPLARTAGGLGICRPKPGPKAPAPADPVFPTTADPHYKKLLAAIQAAARQLARVKRFDMEGFRPNPHYIREMARYRALPATLRPDQPIDVYAADQAYWRLFWYRPTRLANGP